MPRYLTRPFYVASRCAPSCQLSRASCDLSGRRCLAGVRVPEVRVASSARRCRHAVCLPHKHPACPCSLSPHPSDRDSARLEPTSLTLTRSWFSSPSVTHARMRTGSVCSGGQRPPPSPVQPVGGISVRCDDHAPSSNASFPAAQSASCPTNQSSPSLDALRPKHADTTTQILMIQQQK